jgi:uncharacterized protein YneF (UPF0154 family)
MGNFIFWLFSTNSAVNTKRVGVLFIPPLVWLQLLLGDRPATLKIDSGFTSYLLLITVLLYVFLVGGMYFTNRILVRNTDFSQRVLGNVFKNNPRVLQDPQKAIDTLELMSGAVIVGIAAVVLSL